MDENEERARNNRLRIHFLVGLLAAHASGGAIWQIVQGAEDPAGARAALRLLPLRLPEDARAIVGGADEHFHVDEQQARMIMDMRLIYFTGRERARCMADLASLVGESVPLG